MKSGMLLIALGVVILILSACGTEATPTPGALSLPESNPFKLVVAPEIRYQLGVSSRLNLPSTGFTPLALTPRTGFGESGDVDVFEMGDRLYAAVAQDPGGYMLVDATDPTQPTRLGTWQVNPTGSTEHVRAFRQGDRWYLALPFEANRSTPPPCAGLAIVEITDPENPVLLDVHNGSSTGAAEIWCGVHSIALVSNDDGDAEHLLITSQDTSDLRVLDIRDLDQVRETNFYHLHDHPHGPRAWAHHMNVVGDRVYASFWDGGVMILDKSALLSGGSSEQVELTSQGDIGATDFGAHDAYPAADGEFVFVNDAFRSEAGLRIFDIRDLANPKPFMTVDREELQTQRHTLLVKDNLLLVPWRSYGVKVFRYDFSQPEQPVFELVAFQEVRDSSRDGAAGIAAIAVHSCALDGEIRTCVFASDSSLGLFILALDDALT